MIRLYNKKSTTQLVQKLTRTFPTLINSHRIRKVEIYPPLAPHTELSLLGNFLPTPPKTIHCTSANIIPRKTKMSVDNVASLSLSDDDQLHVSGPPRTEKKRYRLNLTPTTCRCCSSEIAVNAPVLPHSFEGSTKRMWGHILCVEALETDGDDQTTHMSTWKRTGNCAYGDKCFFSHDLDAKGSSSVGMHVNKHAAPKSSSSSVSSSSSSSSSSRNTPSRGSSPPSQQVSFFRLAEVHLG